MELHDAHRSPVATAAAPAAGLIAILVAAGCGGEPTRVWDEPTLTEGVQRLGEELPTCTTRAAGIAAQARGPRRQVVDLAEALRFAREVRGGADAVPAALSATGSCGGSLLVDSSHENGVTDYVAELDQFCVTSEDGDITLDGVLKVREIGTPSPSGPIISATELSTDGAIEVAHLGEVIDIVIDGARTDYGYPGVGTPGAPDPASPNVTRVSRVTIVSQDLEHYFGGLRLEQDSGVPASVHILAGRVGTAGEGEAELRTPSGDPLIVDIDGTIIGTVEAHGAEGTLVTMTARNGEPGVFDFTLNGAPFHTTLDCSRGVEPMQEIMIALIESLPIY